jgi:putative DNA primase/helicase
MTDDTTAQDTDERMDDLIAAHGIDEPMDELAAHGTDEPMDELAARRRPTEIHRRRQREPPTPAPGYESIMAAISADRIIADRAEPRGYAELYLEENRMHDDPAIVWWAKSWWRYDTHSNRFRPLMDEDLRADLWRVLDRVDIEKTSKETGEKTLERLIVKSPIVSNVVDAFRSVVPRLPNDAPRWVKYDYRDPPLTRLVPCKNGILDIQERTLIPRTARLFTTTAVTARWFADPHSCPEWLAFLRSVWGDDEESIRALQEIFGYLLTSDTSHQKLFALIGPPRSGKGTITRVLTALLGEDAVTNPMISSLEGAHGLAPFVGKTLAILGDARIGGKTDQAHIVEQLLSLSGEDALTINPKGVKAFEMRLRTRVLLVSNEVPGLYDSSGALASRWILLKMSQSFYGREDRGLEARLLAELPGIFQWAVDGWHTLQARGRFAQPAASAEALEEMEAVSTPHRVFVRDMCEISADHEIACQYLYEQWVDWCKQGGREPGNNIRFGANLKSAFPTIRRVQKRLPNGNGKTVRYYAGICMA